MLAYACDDKDKYERDRDVGNLKVWGFPSDWDIVIIFSQPAYSDLTISKKKLWQHVVLLVLFLISIRDNCDLFLKIVKNCIFYFSEKSITGIFSQ